jgi:hypothetical protein
MAARAHLGTHLTINALDLGPREYAALAARYHAARRAVGRRTSHRTRALSGAWSLASRAAMLALGVGTVALVFAAVGAPAWVCVAAAVGAFAPIAFALHRSRRGLVVERHAPPRSAAG